MPIGTLLCPRKAGSGLPGEAPDGPPSAALDKWFTGPGINCTFLFMLGFGLLSNTALVYKSAGRVFVCARARAGQYSQAAARRSRPRKTTIGADSTADYPADRLAPRLASACLSNSEHLGFAECDFKKLFSARYICSRRVKQTLPHLGARFVDPGMPPLRMETRFVRAGFACAAPLHGRYRYSSHETQQDPGLGPCIPDARSASTLWHRYAPSLARADKTTGMAEHRQTCLDWRNSRLLCTARGMAQPAQVTTDVDMYVLASMRPQLTCCSSLFGAVPRPASVHVELLPTRSAHCTVTVVEAKFCP
eukprot:SAG31_NODE_2429_length_5709_cov_19.399287_2_plen_306_part_00